MKFLSSDFSMTTSRDDLPKDGSNPCRIRKMYLAAAAALLNALALGMISGYSAPATYDMTTNPKSPFTPDDNQVTWVGSIIGLGLMIGAFISSPLADKIGRKHVVVLNIMPLILGWGLIFYAKSFTPVLIGRLLCGICCGTIIVAVPMYTVEISTPEVRGLLGSAFQGFLVIGHLMVTFAGYYLSWWWLAFYGACFAVVGVTALAPMPESPRWLVTKGRTQEAIQVIAYLQGDFLDPVEECRIIQDDLNNQPKTTITCSEFFHPTIYKPALLSMALFFLQEFCGANVVFFYTSSIFEVSEDMIDPKIASIILAAVQVVVTLMSNFVVDKAGRKILLLISGALMALSLIALGIYYRLSTEDDVFKVHFIWLPLCSLVLLTTAYSIGYGPVPRLMSAEMVPVRARSALSGVVTFSLGVFGFAVLKSFSELVDLLGHHGAFWTYSAVSVVGCVFVFFCVPETKGKRLEDMAALFSKQVRLENEFNTLNSINTESDDARLKF